ncbi:MAG: asparagine synthase (glutamine-hydrolyzing) [Erythrobacter sp.]
MCGICGILVHSPEEDLANTVREMADTLFHRGPDGDGVWCDQSAGVGMGHRRLSILDLSAAGAQPMFSACGRYVVVFNAEIYNHLNLRADLSFDGASVAWRGNSDTETLLAAVAHWGLRETLHRACGMFSLALWDRDKQELQFARDRMGEKPLYLARIAGGWAFASELKALLAVPGFDARVCRDAVAAYLAYGYVPENQCIFRDVQKVSPGHIVSITPDAMKPEVLEFQSFQSALNGALENRIASQQGSLDRLEDVLSTVVGEQMLSDVPLGCFLSGGVDSSLVAALMQKESTKPIRTFSIGFSEERFNEAPHAAAVAKHLGTEHTQFIMSEEDALRLIPDLPKIYDEPFADSSQIPTALLCRETRKFVTVALTGDGGDEVFGGYNRHVMGPRLLSKLQLVPQGVRRCAGSAIAACGPSILEEDGWLRRMASAIRLPVTALDKTAVLAPYLGEINDIRALYDHLTRGIYDPAPLMKDDIALRPLGLSFPVEGAEWLMAMDSVTYLPGDILVKVDRASMAASLETRSPYLDSRVVTAAWELPLEMKISGGKGKRILRTLLDRYVPRDLIERPKQGFAIPLDRWLRGGLRQWAEERLFDEALLDLAGLEHAAVGKLWERHQAGTVNNGAKLWTILMLLDWISHYRSFLGGIRSVDSKAYLGQTV